MFAEALNSKSTAFGDPLQAAALFKGAGEQLSAYSEMACWPQDANELTAAIEVDSCIALSVDDACLECFD